jgi:hypothetical protein
MKVLRGNAPAGSLKPQMLNSPKRITPQTTNAFSELEEPNQN